MMPTIWGVYVSWIYMILDTSCQHLGGWMGGFLCTLRAQGWGINIFKNEYLYWIYDANNLGSIWRASRSCRKSVWERHRKSDASQDEKIFFCFYHLVEKIRSFPTMYNTWGCLWGQIDETKHFLQKSGLKTPILGDTVLDHPTSKRAETHNFWGIVNFHKCFEKSGT